ncbi:MAG: SH3 domain-containing protein [Chloroflexi bacterium]|nr:SH3 domain-containing protein [Chloroflexota bacterium]
MKKLSKAWQLRLLFAVSMIWLGPTIACGSFAPRPLPTATVAVVTPVDPQTTGGTGGPATEAPITPTLALLPTETPIPAPTPTFTATAVPGTALAKGQPARVTTEDGLNLRDSASTGGQLITRLAGDQKVTIVDGPVSADDFTWWKLDDGQGNVGWAVQGDKDGDWLSPQLGEAKPANRAPKVGERVQVTTEGDQLLTIRATPGRDGATVAQVGEGKQYTVIAGPQSVEGFTWYQIRSDDGSLVGWAADGDNTERWLSPLE